MIDVETAASGDVRIVLEPRSRPKGHLEGALAVFIPAESVKPRKTSLFGRGLSDSIVEDSDDKGIEVFVSPFLEDLAELLNGRVVQLEVHSLAAK